MKSDKNETSKNQKSRKDSAIIRLDENVKKVLETEVEKLKKVKKGSGKISSSLILEMLLPKLTDDDRNKILAQTITGEDREKVAFENYSKKHKGTKKSEFKDLTLYGEININDYLPREMWRLKASEKTTVSKSA